MAPRRRILLVEDEGLLAASLIEELDQLGYGARAVNSGERALSSIDEDPPDLILMDIKLKGRLDGIETSVHVNRKRFVPVIYLTAHSDPSFLERAKVTEPFGYLIKPVEKQDLKCAIEIALHKSAAERERSRLIARLQETLAQAKTFEGLLPICWTCKKIRDTDGRWHRLEDYLLTRSQIRFSHSICPACLRDYFPDFPGGMLPEPE